MQVDEAFARLRSILADDFQVPAERVTADASLRSDLGLDSLSLTDLAFLVQRDFGFRAEAETFAGVTSVGALAALIAAKAAAPADE